MLLSDHVAPGDARGGGGRLMLERLREHEAWAEPPLSSILWRSSLYRLWRGQQARRSASIRLWADRDGELYRVTLAISKRFSARRPPARSTRRSDLPEEDSSASPAARATGRRSLMS